MKSSLVEILDGRPAIAYGAGEYFGRFCGRTAELFDYFLDDNLAGQNRNGIPIRPVASLASEQRQVCVFLFCRDIAPALLALDEHGFRWRENVFDARVFGDGSQIYDDYHILRSPEEVQAIPEVQLHQADGAQWTVRKILVRKRPGGSSAGVFLAEDALLKCEDLILSSDTRICCGRGALTVLGGIASLPHDFTLNCSLASKVEIADGVVFSPRTMINTASHTAIRIGPRSTFGNNLDLYAYAPIEIGSDCMFSSHVFVASGAGHDLVVGAEPKPPKKVVVGDHVWIGWGAHLLAGATLGSGSMIASGSLVNREFPEHSLVAGMPGKVIASEISWNRDFTAYKKLFYPGSQIVRDDH
jgi:acetyltransferase-like isoleucine patch superfamily enzyme